MIIIAKFRSFACELYPDDIHHLEILEYIKKYLNYAYILHDKDTYTQDNIDDFVEKNKIQPPWKVGDIKKSHYHVILKFKNPRSLDKLKKELGIEHLETCNFYYYARYLIHKDNPRKFQYNENEIVTNIGLNIHNALKKDYNSQEQDTRLLLDYIFSRMNQSYVSLKNVTEYAMENDLLLDLKKNINFYSRFIDDSGFRRI